MNNHEIEYYCAKPETIIRAIEVARKAECPYGSKYAISFREAWADHHSEVMATLKEMLMGQRIG